MSGGVFETMLVEGGRVRLLDRHLARLARAVSDAVIASVEHAARGSASPDPVVTRMAVSDEHIKPDRFKVLEQKVNRRRPRVHRPSDRDADANDAAVRAVNENPFHLSTVVTGG